MYRLGHLSNKINKMDQRFTFRLKPVCAFISISFLLMPGISESQQLKITDFGVFGVNAVQIAPSSYLNGGSLGSYKLVKSTGIIGITGNIYSGGTVDLNTSNTVTGKITAGN